LRYPESYPCQWRAGVGPRGIGWAPMSRHRDHPLPAFIDALGSVDPDQPHGTVRYWEVWFGGWLTLSATSSTTSSRSSVPPFCAASAIPCHKKRAFPGSAYAVVAKIGVWACSAFAALLGGLTLLLSPPPVTEAQRADCQHPRPVMKGDSNAGVGQNGRVIPSGNVPSAHGARRPIDRARNLGDAARARNARQ